MSPAVGALHPGQMGAAVAAQLLGRGVRVLWHPADRSLHTVVRATAAGLEPIPDLADLLGEAEIVLSICPPEFAEDIARQVAKHNYSGWYVEANAISPHRCNRIADFLDTAGAGVLDSSIFGPPPTGTRSVRLYLTGDHAGIARVTELFAGTSVETVPIDRPFGAASALKMSYASFQRASRARACGQPRRRSPARRNSEKSPFVARRTGLPPQCRCPRLALDHEMREIVDTLTPTFPSDLPLSSRSHLRSLVRS